MFTEVCSYQCTFSADTEAVGSAPSDSMVLFPDPMSLTTMISSHLLKRKSPPWEIRRLPRSSFHQFASTSLVSYSSRLDLQ